jgi:PhzF family phenazine biosynthesis protein
MTPPRFLQLDVFTPRPGGGNPLGVVLGAGSWSAEAMQAFARWTELVETTFVLPPSTPKASYRLRIFTPQREIPFAGHPSVGSAHAALETGLVPAGAPLVQECGAGLLPLLVEQGPSGREIFVQAPAARVLQQGQATDVAPLLREVRLGRLSPAFVEGGRRWWMAELAEEAELRAWHPDHAAIAALAAASDSLGLCVFARSADPEFDLVVRAFPAGVGIVEDPASGAANGLIAAYIAQQEPLSPLATGYRVSQGRELGRDARLSVRIESGAVWVGGQTCTVIDGSLHWPGT